MNLRFERPPHRVVDEILDNLVEVPVDVVQNISRALDKGPLGTKGPHKAVEELFKGAGKVVKDAGETVSSVLDKPLELVGR